ncbi:MAG: winged helix-turn-helix domain-containing protein [Clostridium celatum]|nr:winged helix-turn-helix domain-containing protein [Clostridium celatum]MDU4979377.1 winged helix-turn-helix domain-containing protein [Clostridium celatum]
MEKNIIRENISFAIRPVNEFAMTAMQYFNQEEHFNLIKEYNIKIDKRITEIFKAFDDNISPFLKSEIEFFNKTKTLTVMILAFVDYYEEIKTVEDYFKVFDSASDEEVFNFIGGEFIGDYNKDDNSEWGKVINSLPKMKEYIENLKGIKNNLVKDVISLFDSPNETRMRLRYIISSFYDIYKRFEDELMDKIIKETNILRKKFNENPEKFCDNHLFKGMFDPKKVKVEINVSYIFIIGWRMSTNNPQKARLNYGFRSEEYLRAKNSVEYLDKFLKLISDKTRQRILVLLSRESRYTQSIAKELGLTPATVNYHLQNFLMIGLVDIDNRKDNKVYYSLNKEKANDYIELLKGRFNLI